MKKLVFCLPKYFPFGGLQANFLNIARRCREKGAEINVYTMAWEGPVEDDFNIHVVDIRAWRNHARNVEFIRRTLPKLESYDSCIGFMKMPGLDWYYAADPCFQARARRTQPLWYRWSARYRYFTGQERSVFEEASKTRILALSAIEIKNYQQYYQTQDSRFNLLLPGISMTHKAPENRQELGQKWREQHKIGVHEKLLLCVGSSFRTKGLDRSIHAIASLPSELRKSCRLWVIGVGNKKPFEALARRLGLDEQVVFLGGRDDVSRWLWAADLLLHPAYTENTGNALLEAMVAGVPVLASGICGYAFHVERAAAGLVLQEPFVQGEMNRYLLGLLTDDKTVQRSSNGVEYGQQQDLYGRAEQAASLILQDV